jgi:hypothetical protein
MQNRCRVCAERTTGSEIILVDAHFGPFGDSANLDANRCTVCAECTTGSEIILDAPGGTPR